MKNQYIYILAIIVFIWTSCSEKQKIKEKLKLNVDTSGLSLKYLDKIHKKSTFKAYDKSLIEYINSNPNKPDSIRKVIYLQPLGNMNSKVEKLISKEVIYLKKFFQLEVKLLPRINFDDIKQINSVKTRMVPKNDYEYYGKVKGVRSDLIEQIEAKSMIENYLKNIKPKDAIALIGITEHDLYLSKMNYVYGLSYLKNGIGIISTYRITDYEEDAKSNIRKVLTKQVANLFSIPNVKDYNCVLNFHESIYELENGVQYISPRALEKLKYAIGFNYKKRFNDLKDFWKLEGDSVETNYYEICLKLESESIKK